VGQIERQTIKGSLYSYIGVAIGFVTTAVLFPRLLTTEQIGVLSLLVAYAQLISVVGNLGFPSVVIRFFPYFQNKQKGHNGLLFLVLLVLGVGFTIGAVLYSFVEQLFIVPDLENLLYLKYSWFVYPLSFFVIAFMHVDAYNRALGNAVTGSLIKEITQRVFIFISAILFWYFSFIHFDELVLFYVASFSSSSIILFIFLKYKKELFLRPHFSFLKKKLRKVMFSYSLYSVIAGLGNVVIQRIDAIMIGYFVNVSAVGIYTTTFFFGTIILVPSRALSRISSIIVADALKMNDFQRIKSVYVKSSINQFLIGALLLVGIWSNIDNCFRILPREFEEGKYVILFIGLSNLVNLSLGINFQIIHLSRYYRSITYFLLIFCTLIVITNYLLIPIYGIAGAALASFISVTIYSLLRVIYVYRKFSFQPFGIVHVKIIGITLICFMVNLVIPVMDHFIVDIAIRSGLIGLLYTFIAFKLNISEEMNALIRKSLALVSGKM
tara:strand:- start:19676 stop:21160 length:1485 start_codon:yes stop_codon:yes gene_type:complete